MTPIRVAKILACVILLVQVTVLNFGFVVIHYMVQCQRLELCSTAWKAVTSPSTLTMLGQAANNPLWPASSGGA
jgi:hypothetical protein